MTNFDAAFPEPDDLIIKKTGNLNLEIMAAVEVFCSHYKKHNQIPFYTALDHDQITEMVQGIESIIYAHEGIKKSK
jgi:hypothetical protein